MTLMAISRVDHWSTKLQPDFTRSTRNPPFHEWTCNKNLIKMFYIIYYCTTIKKFLLYRNYFKIFSTRKFLYNLINNYKFIRCVPVLNSTIFLRPFLAVLLPPGFPTVPMGKCILFNSCSHWLYPDLLCACSQLLVLMHPQMILEMMGLFHRHCYVLQ